MTDAVLDASAVLALLHNETGASTVAALLSGAAVSAVNVAEIGARLVDRGMPPPLAGEAIRALGLEVVPFDAELAQASTALRQGTRPLGLSLGDRACLALAQQRGVPAVTADRAWQRLGGPIKVTVIR
jgi:PIN domain nuclease of toxin-antitoxin system